MSVGLRRDGSVGGLSDFLASRHDFVIKTVTYMVNGSVGLRLDGAVGGLSEFACGRQTHLLSRKYQAPAMADITLYACRHVSCD